MRNEEDWIIFAGLYQTKFFFFFLSSKLSSCLHDACLLKDPVSFFLHSSSLNRSKIAAAFLIKKLHRIHDVSLLRSCLRTSLALYACSRKAALFFIQETWSPWRTFIKIFLLSIFLVYVDALKWEWQFVTRVHWSRILSFFQISIRANRWNFF